MDRRDKSKLVKTPIDSFRYPRLGPGMMWEAGAARIREMGGEVVLGRRVEECRHSEAAEALRYRDFLVVVPIAKDRKPLPDNWICIHDPSLWWRKRSRVRAWASGE